MANTEYLHLSLLLLLCFKLTINRLQIDKNQEASKLITVDVVLVLVRLLPSNILTLEKSINKQLY